MKLSYFPQIKVVHTSKTFHGQVYVSMLNWLMMIGTVLVAAIYNNTTSLGNAYGVCVIFVTFFDTCMVSLAALVVWRIHPAIVVFPWLVFACLDGTFLSSALTKVPDGAWFTLTLAAVLASIFILWRFGKERQWAAEAADRFKLSTLVTEADSRGSIKLTDRFGGAQLSQIRGLGIFFDKSGEKTPHVFSHFVSKLVAIPEASVFFHIRPLEAPSVPLEERYTISRLGLPGCYRLVVRHGYNDEVITPDLAGLVFEQLRDFVIRKHANAERLQVEQEGEQEKIALALQGPKATSNDSAEDATDLGIGSQSNGFGSTGTTPVTPDTDSPSEKTPHGDSMSAATATELRRLENAFHHQSLYIIGKESIRVSRSNAWWRIPILRFFVFIRENTRGKIANLRVPTEKVIEVGFVKEI